ncbi:MAG TPA: VCBS repeat-containing protein [Bryobacteraceae bacterium]|jgi:hypothetical protein
MKGYRPSRRQFLMSSGAALLSAATSQTRAIFEEIPASVSGITWVHDNAKSDLHYLPETLGPGCAFLDYDNDGWMDIYLVNSGPCDFWKPSKPVRNALYKNNRDGTFTDVTEKAGVAGGTFGMGVAVGDYNNDGFPDLFVTSYGRCILYRNNGDGTFTDVTAKAGLPLDGWTTVRSGSITITTANWICSFAASWITGRQLISLAGTTNWAGTITAFHGRSDPPQVSFTTTTATARSPRWRMARTSRDRLARVWVW